MMKTLGIFVAFMATSLLLSSANAKTLKTYSGEYEAPGHISLNDYAFWGPYQKYGHADYTYYETEKGRSYHGLFTYKDKGQTITGRFVDNVQNGQWTYQSYDLLRNKIVVKLNFKSGILDGQVSFSVYSHKNNSIIKKCSCTFSNGKFTGHLSASNLKLPHNGYLSDQDANVITGQFDEEGFPVGKWTAKGKTREWIEQFSENDTCRLYCKNLSTGDPIVVKNGYFTEPFLTNLIITSINEVLEIVAMRDTEQRQIPKFSFRPRHIQDGMVLKEGDVRIIMADPETNEYTIVAPRRPSVEAEEEDIRNRFPEDNMTYASRYLEMMKNVPDSVFDPRTRR